MASADSRRVVAGLRLDGGGAGFALPVFLDHINTDVKLIQEIDELTNCVVGFRPLLGSGMPMISIQSGPFAYIGKPQIFVFLDEGNKIYAGNLAEIESILRKFASRCKNRVAVALQIAELIGTNEEKEEARIRMREVIFKKNGEATANAFYEGSVLRYAIWDRLLANATGPAEAKSILLTRNRLDVSATPTEAVNLFRANTETREFAIDGPFNMGVQRNRAMRIYELVEAAAVLDPESDADLLNRAYMFSMEAHGDKKLAPAGWHYTDSTEIANILLDYEVDRLTIATALLHDSLDTPGGDRTQLDEQFGKSAGELVEGVRRAAQFGRIAEAVDHSKDLLEILRSVPDLRAWQVKLADRLHNMRKIERFDPETRSRAAEEAIARYAPLAGLLGMERLREELEDLAFRELCLDSYTTISRHLEDYLLRNQNVIQKIMTELDRNLRENNVTAKIHGRMIRPYEIWLEAKRHGKWSPHLANYCVFLIEVESESDFHRVYEIVVDKWSLSNDGSVDYMVGRKKGAGPSKRAKVVGPGGHEIELLIVLLRKNEDDCRSDGHLQARSGKRSVVDIREVLRSQDVLDRFKSDYESQLLRKESIFCFGSSGTIITLPVGANSIDFAYAVDADIGNSLVGSKINGRLEPLHRELKTGDIVEIYCAKIQNPSRAWEEIVVTEKARREIRRWIASKQMQKAT